VDAEPNGACLVPLDVLQSDAIYCVNMRSPPIEKRTGHPMPGEVERKPAPNRACANDGDRQ
jgi:hypothetical protein